MSARLHRARAAIELRRWTDAERELREVLSADPNDPVAWGLCAQARLGLGDGKGALAAAAERLRLAPNDEWGHRLRAIALRILFRYPEALAAIEAAAALAPAEPTVQLELSRCLEKTGRPRDARTAMDRAVALAPESASILAAAGGLALREDRPQDALTRLKAAAAIDPLDAVLLNDLGVAYFRVGQREDAGLAWEAAVRLDPTCTVAKENLRMLVGRNAGPWAALHLVGGLLLLPLSPGLGLGSMFSGVRQGQRYARGRDLYAKMSPEWRALFDKIDADRGRS